jgi:hypothetical protein
MGAMLNLLKIGRYKNTLQTYREKLKNAISIFEDVVNFAHNFS